MRETLNANFNSWINFPYITLFKSRARYFSSSLGQGQMLENTLLVIFLKVQMAMEPNLAHS